MANAFPYNQCVAGFTPSSGPFAGYSFSVSIFNTGITVCQYSPVPSTTGQTGYNTSSVTGLYGGGDTNTSFVFLGSASSAQTPPYYFVGASESGNYYLYSITPTTPVGTQNVSFTSANVNEVTQIGSRSNPIAAMFYDPTPGVSPNFFVIDSSGEWATWTVTMNTSNGVPTFVSYENTWMPEPLTIQKGSNAQIQIAAPPPGSANAPSGVCYITGVYGNSIGTATGTAAGNGNGPASNLLQYSGTNSATTQFVAGAPTDTIAIACTPTCMYIATVGGAIYECSYPTSLTNPTTTATLMYTLPPSTYTLTSLAWSPVTCDAATYTSGVLVIGGYETSSGTGETAQGSIWTCAPGLGPVGCMYSQPTGPVYGLVADQNGHALGVLGVTGLLCFDLIGQPPYSAVIVQDIEGTPGSESVWSKIEAGFEIFFQASQLRGP